MSDFETKVARYIADNCPIGHDSHVIVALSGGADSVALLAVLTALGYRCTAAHCDFHLRGEESERDRLHAVTTARHLGVECHVKHFDTTGHATVRGISIEMAARELRYEWFEQLRRDMEADAVAVAHHRDDNIETFFLNLLRSTGIAGLTGMRPRRDDIIRPLLCVSRDEILAYLDARSLTYVTDSSNLSNDYRRNKLRNIILPTIEREFPGAAKTIGNTMSHLTDNRDLMDDYISLCRQRYINGDTINLIALRDNEPHAAAVLTELLRGYGFNATQSSDILASSDLSGRQFPTTDYVAVTNCGQLLLSRRDTIDRDLEYTIDLTADISYPINLSVRQFDYTPGMRLEFDCSTLYLDASVLDGNPRFMLRHWRDGDRLSPFGMRGTRLVSDIFSDAHLSLPEKDRTWLLTRDGTILWVIGHRTSRHYPITPTTRRAIAIKALPHIRPLTSNIR
ncbi:MAG: tRNA lysidine(34) synthetase TilS [Pseudoflavonifractor sp.]|nr:tRNA lysidine(34) synthetase TilS [Pseudoflavonifractor sp.]